MIKPSKLLYSNILKQVIVEQMTFKQLLDSSENKSDPSRIDRAKHVNPSSTRVSSTDDGERWIFNYKSQGLHSTTGKRYHGYIQFLKEDVSSKENAEDLYCRVHCDCPDYFYRWEYNNAEAGAGDFCSGHNRQSPRPRDAIPHGVGNLGEGLCKHLISLGEYLNTKIGSNAPQPTDKLSTQPKIKLKYANIPKSKTEPTVDAPKPEDTYDDSRSGSNTLQEGMRSMLYEKMNKFIRENPQFDIVEGNQLNEMIIENHETGEWWIDNRGSIIYADGDSGESGHIQYVVHILTNEILEHFGIDENEPDVLSNYEEQIKSILIDNGRLDDDENNGWENMRGAKYAGPADIIIKKLIEDKVFEDREQTTRAVLISYGSSDQDARDYAMKYWRWKIMKSSNLNIDIQTWHLKPEDLGIIVRGIWEIMEDTDNDLDPDNKLGIDGYKGPRVNVTVEASGKQFHNIPLEVLEKKVPTSLNNYKSGLPWELSGVNTLKREGINEEYHYLHKEYRLYEGNRHIVAIFEDNSRLKFEVHFRHNRGEDKEKWRKKAFTTWKSLANEIYRDVQLSDSYNPIQKSWKQSFKEALKHPKLQEYIRKPHEKNIFDKTH